LQQLARGESVVWSGPDITALCDRGGAFSPAERLERAKTPEAQLEAVVTILFQSGMAFEWRLHSYPD